MEGPTAPLPAYGRNSDRSLEGGLEKRDRGGIRHLFRHNSVVEAAGAHPAFLAPVLHSIDRSGWPSADSSHRRGEAERSKDALRNRVFSRRLQTARGFIPDPHRLAQALLRTS